MANETKKLIKQEEKALKKREKENRKRNKKNPDASVAQVGLDAAPAHDLSPELVEHITTQAISGLNNTKDDELIGLEGDTDEIKRVKRKRRIAYERNREKLERAKYLKDNELVEAVVPVKMYEKFLYYSTSLRSMEKIQKRLRVAVTFFIITTIAFTSLFIYELGETRRTYEHMYTRAVNDATDLIQGYIDNPIDEERFSRMITSELNTIRMSADLLKVDNKYTNRLNDLHFFMVDYPDQMSSHYQEVLDILAILKNDVTDKDAYTMIDDLDSQLDKLGK